MTLSEFGRLIGATIQPSEIHTKLRVCGTTRYIQQFAVAVALVFEKEIYQRSRAKHHSKTMKCIQNLSEDLLLYPFLIFEEQDNFLDSSISQLCTIFVLNT